jgi:hypothetical protein
MFEWWNTRRGDPLAARRIRQKRANACDRGPGVARWTSSMYLAVETIQCVQRGASCFGAEGVQSVQELSNPQSVKAAMGEVSMKREAAAYRSSG